MWLRTAKSQPPQTTMECWRQFSMAQDLPQTRTTKRPGTRTRTKTLTNHLLYDNQIKLKIKSVMTRLFMIALTTNILGGLCLMTSNSIAICTNLEV